MPDFSFAGYKNGSTIPEVDAVVSVAVAAGDCTPIIQSAIDQVSARPATKDGFRGAVLLGPGEFRLSGRLVVSADGVVIRGFGSKTVLRVHGADRRAVVRIVGSGRSSRSDQFWSITDAFVPCGADRLTLASTEGLSAGDRIHIDHPSTKEWIAALGMDRFPSRDKGSYLDWKPGTVDRRFERTVRRIDGNSIEVDVPLTATLDGKLSSSMVRKSLQTGRIRGVGVENLSIAIESAGPADEQHAWSGVVLHNAEDCWVRSVDFSGIAGSAVAVWETCRCVSVVDCRSIQPCSEIGGYRRRTFFTAGSQTLFLRCRSEHGGHDFSVGHLATGPNVFSDCRAEQAHRWSGPIGSWACGVLYDNVHVDGAGIALTNRETEDSGTGWSAAWSVLWQCSAPLITCRRPPTAQNWAMGVWGQFVGDGQWRQLNEFAKPDSLYQAQLRDRPGSTGAETTSKRERSAEQEFADTPRMTAALDKLPISRRTEPLQSLTISKDGTLLIADKPLEGKRATNVWWRGSSLPSREAELGHAITRFVPDREGTPATEDLNDLAARLKTSGIAAVEHHWGLWYDRRRDDHQMIRRMDGDAWAPFDEQPWLRSGVGKAWDGLSRYDLTKFNPWYFARLREFADAARSCGLVFVQQMYFQHNILEAGAHWADFPWRPTNCLQDTGFPEPPPYVGSKRIFMADKFYDVSHEVRRRLHQQYVRKCLDTLGDCPNVIFQLGEEYSGPRAFMEFWLDTVAAWQKETGRKVLVSLSATKDVQDAILSDPKRSALVSVIDLKYWWYTADGGKYDPRSTTELAPRQQLREWKGPKSRSDESIARAVREYRGRFPDKAVTVSFDGYGGRWDTHGIR